MTARGSTRIPDPIPDIGLAPRGQALAIAHRSRKAAFEKPLSTAVLPFREFKPSDDRYQNYYSTDPERPFCKRYIDPKLDYIKKHFAQVALPTRGADRDLPEGQNSPPV